MPEQAVRDVEKDLRVIGERISRLETLADGGVADRKEIKESIETLVEVVDNMTKEFERYRGFVAGAAAIATLIWSLVTFAGGWIWEAMTKGTGG